MLLVFGIFLGYFRDSLGIIGDSTAIVEKLNPHMILLIFIPTLIFESGKLSYTQLLTANGMLLGNVWSAFLHWQDLVSYGVQLL